MKELFLIRHAKSDWDDYSISDFDRPLKPRGVRNAAEMSAQLKNSARVPQLIVSSTAKRALDTAIIFAENLGIPVDSILKTDELYLAEPETIIGIIKKLPENIASVAIFSHNPGITETALLLSQLRIDNMPTCSMVHVSFNVSSWNDIDQEAVYSQKFTFPERN